MSAIPPERGRVLAEVSHEVGRQYRQHGQAPHPDGTGPDLLLSDLPVHRGPESYLARAKQIEAWARLRCKAAPGEGGDTFEKILTEEWAEVLGSDAGSPELRSELVQVAAVAVAWIVKLDLEGAGRPH